MKRLMLILLLSILLTGCDFISNGDDDNQISFDIEPSVYIENLSSQLNETSGLIWFNNKIWSLNDSGGENEIYAINNEGEIIQTVEIENKTNTDWEAMTQDENFIYIGDFGNNNGDRKDLKIFKVSKNDLNSNDNLIKVNAEEITFSYSSQSDFSERKYQHEFDCEAMFSFQDHIYLLSKDWRYFKTSVYRISKEPGQYDISALTSYDVNGLITGADISSNGKYLALLGYSISFPFMENLNPFIHLFNFNSDNIFGEKTIFFNPTNLAGTQPEGISFTDDNTLLFSSEKTKVHSQKVYKVDLRDYKKHLD